jgi:cell division protein FtsL
MQYANLHKDVILSEKKEPDEAQILTKLEMTFLRKEKIFLFQALEAGFK